MQNPLSLHPQLEIFGARLDFFCFFLMASLRRFFFECIIFNISNLTTSLLQHLQQKPRWNQQLKKQQQKTLRNKQPHEVKHVGKGSPPIKKTQNNNFENQNCEPQVSMLFSFQSRSSAFQAFEANPSGRILVETSICKPFRPFGRGLTITMVIQHLLNGMIFQVPLNVYCTLPETNRQNH